MFILGLLIFLIGCGIAGMVCFDFKNSTARKGKIPVAISICISSLVIWYFFTSVVIVEAGNRGAVFNSFTGVKINKVLGEGMHIIPKVVNKVTIYDVYTKTLTDKIESLSSDGLKMTFDVSIRFRINDDKVAFIKQNVGSEKDLLEKILYPTVRSKMRDISAKYTAQEAYAGKRDQIQESYRNILTDFFASEEYLIAEQILIRQVTPPEALTLKITETKVAEQEVIKQKNILAAEKQKKEQEITKAEGEARALRIKANAISNNPKILELKWIEKWSGNLPTIMAGNNGMLLNIPSKGY